MASRTTRPSLTPYLTDGLDILFVALNPPSQSNTNGHYFSGKGSRFFKLLYLSKLITMELDKKSADDLVFGGTEYNHKECRLGVVDLVESLVETDRGKVRPQTDHVELLIGRVIRHRPRFVCIIHSKVRDALNKSRLVNPRLDYGNCGRVIGGSEAVFFLNYFPNGNSIKDEPKVQIFRELRDLL